MFTCCPHCQTCFRITKPQLDVAQGKVRCGQCKQVFDARKYLHEKKPQPAAAKTAVKRKTDPAVKTAASKPPPAPVATTPAARVKTDNPPEPPKKAPLPDNDEIDIELFAYTRDTEDFDKDDSWLDKLDENDLPEEPNEEDEENDLHAQEEETEIIKMDDFPADLFSMISEEHDQESDKGNTPLDHAPQEDVQEDKEEAESGMLQQNTQPAADSASRYEYVDPDELLHEEKDIDDILAEMNSQLSQVTETNDEKPATTPPAASARSVDAEDDRGKTAAVTEADTDQSLDDFFSHIPVSSETTLAKDNFESEFLASLDSTIEKARHPSTPPPAEPAPPPKAPPPPVSKEEPEDDGDMFDFGDETHGAQKNSQQASGTAEREKDELPYPLRQVFGEEEERRFRPGRLLLGLVGILLLLALLAIQLTVFRGTDLADRLPVLEPLLAKACQTLPCRYTGPSDISQIKLLSRDIRVHPNAKKALLITATIINRAPYKQPYPDIQITLSDLSGEVVAERRFSPEEYLGRMNSPFLRMPAGTPVKIALEVLDPGKDAVNFEFSFR